MLSAFKRNLEFFLEILEENLERSRTRGWKNWTRRLSLSAKHLPATLITTPGMRKLLKIGREILQWTWWTIRFTSTHPSLGIIIRNWIMKGIRNTPIILVALQLRPNTHYEAGSATDLLHRQVNEHLREKAQWRSLGRNRPDHSAEAARRDQAPIPM